MRGTGGRTPGPIRRGWASADGSAARRTARPRAVGPGAARPRTAAPRVTRYLAEAMRMVTILSGLVTLPLSSEAPFLILSTTSMPETT